MRHYLITVKEQKLRLYLQGAVQLLLKDTVKINRIIHYVRIQGVHFFSIFTKTSFVFKKSEYVQGLLWTSHPTNNLFQGHADRHEMFWERKGKTRLISRIQRYLLSFSHLSQKRGHFKPQRLTKIQIICTRREYIAQS